MSRKRYRFSDQQVDQAVGRAIRAAREELDLSQESLGLAMGSGRTYVSELERGLKGMTLKKFFRAAHELQLTPSELIDRVNDELRSS